MSDRRLGTGTDRAVSDVIGYVLIFSLIVTTVGIVSAVGFSTLDDRQSAEQINNVEQAFDVFATNVEDVYREDAPSRATEMRLAGGTIQYGEPVTITVRRADDHAVNHTMELTPLVYTERDSEVVYAAGAILRGEPEGSAMLREPPFVLEPDRSLLPFVRTTRSVGLSEITRDGTVRIETRRTNANVTTHPGLEDGGTLELVVDSPRGTAWDGYLRAQADRHDDWTYDESTATLSFETDELSVPRSRVQLRLVT
ncbi:hypothetical protein KM295_07570 [Natronomonas sp. F2-12]|uniref:Uncharacterized protein n=1 Tax=Natronomonas aquatica TaxID=2841590 RepID=A0A9R1CQQ2_9EURY|nr:hypothetical protein [Natronomonas aquatica]MCQ4333338.1 hypothetical protein [Natronomonas aquatica]